MGMIKELGLKLVGIFRRIVKKSRPYIQERTIFHLANLVQFRTSVDAKSYNEEMKKCVDYLEKNMKKMGLEVKKYNYNGLDTLVGRIGNKEETVIFNGHYDVVIDSDNWNDFTLTEGEYENKHVFFGKGVYDMKGSVAAMLAAMECAEKRNMKRRIIFMFVPDEETRGEGTKRTLEQIIKEKSIDQKRTNAIVGESTELNITTKRRAQYMFKVRIPGEKKGKKLMARTYIGQSLHSSEFSIERFREGKAKHPLFAIAEDYVNGKIWGLSDIELGYLEQGKIRESPSNVVPAHGRVWFDGNDTTNPAIDKLLKFINKLKVFDFGSEKSGYGTSISCNRLEHSGEALKFYLDIRIMDDDTEGINEYLRNVAKSCGIEDIELICKKRTLKSDGKWASEIEGIAKKVYGKTKKGSENKGQSDACYFLEQDIPAVEIGPIGGNDHRGYEHATTKSLYILAEIYKKIIES